MSKISLIIQREYITRVRKKSFIVMSVLGPLLIAAMYVVPIWLAMRDSTTQYQIAVVDKDSEFTEALKDNPTHHYAFVDIPVDSIKSSLVNSEAYDAVLYRESEAKNSEKGIVLLSKKQINIELKKGIEDALEANLRNMRMQQLGLQQSTLDSIRTKIDIETKKLTDEGEEKKTSGEIAMVVGFVLALFIYFIIFLYGAQIMRGVIEEKTNRIIELMISSVRPFELMMGKILGVALVVLTQIALWIGLSTVIIMFAGTIMAQIDPAMSQQMAAQQITAEQAQAVQQVASDGIAGYIESFLNMNLGLILFGFVFYFIGGYLSYAALFAAVGAAADNETDTQQFMLPISAPMILTIVLASSMMRDPHGTLAFWLSILPFTSPIAMVLRLPQEPELWEIALSMGILILSFIFTTWIAAKIYRVGILMYGKKVSYRELWKWLRYKA